MYKILIPILAAFTLQGGASLMALPAAPVAPAAVDPDAQYVLGPDSQPQAGVPAGWMSIWKAMPLRDESQWRQFTPPSWRSHAATSQAPATEGRTLTA